MTAMNCDPSNPEHRALKRAQDTERYDFYLPRVIAAWPLAGTHPAYSEAYCEEIARGLARQTDGVLVEVIATATRDRRFDHEEWAKPSKTDACYFVGYTADLPEPVEASVFLRAPLQAPGDA